MRLEAQLKQERLHGNELEAEVEALRKEKERHDKEFIQLNTKSNLDSLLKHKEQQI
jgi:uncharacterized OsmC-like protein